VFLRAQIRDGEELCQAFWVHCRAGNWWVRGICPAQPGSQKQKCQDENKSDEDNDYSLHYKSPTNLLEELSPFLPFSMVYLKFLGFV